MDEDTDIDAAHEKRGYTESRLGSHVAYHFTVNAKGEVTQNRAPTERSGHTRNQTVNLESIAIVLTGNLHEHDAPKEQIEALKALIKKLDALYTFKEIVPHGYASPSACPGKYVIEALKDLWRYESTVSVSRYYSPVVGQSRYYRKGDTAYRDDVEMNCGLYTPAQIAAGAAKDGSAGDCTHTANGYQLKPEDALKVAACPPSYAFGTVIEIEDYGMVTCVDRGGAIQGNRLDIWAGYGEVGLDNIKKTTGGIKSAQIMFHAH